MMKGFKDTTKTQYSKGGCGCGPKGAAKVAQANAAFKQAKPIKKAEGGAVARGNRMQALEGREEAKLLREVPRETAERKATAPRRPVVQRDPREPVIRNPLMDRLSSTPSQRGEMPIRRKSGGLAVKK